MTTVKPAIPHSASPELEAKIKAEADAHATAREAIEAGDAGPWVRLHRDDYKWPFNLGWNDRNEPIIECHAHDVGMQMRDLPSAWRLAIIKFLEEERRGIFARAEEAQKALPFVSLKTTGRRTRTTHIENYWVHEAGVTGVRAARVGYHRVGALFALPQFGCDVWLLEQVFAEIIRQGRDIAKGADVERGFIQAICEILHECHNHAPWIIRNVLRADEERWNNWLRASVEEDEKRVSERGRKAAKARWRKAKSPSKRTASRRVSQPLKKAA
jgi:hypothetical protein